MVGLEGLKCFFKPASSFTNRYEGFSSNNGKWTLDFQETRAKNKHIAILLDENSINLFNQFLTDTKKSKIQVILVYSPEYMEGRDFITNRKEFLSLFYSFEQQYQLPFLDYSNDRICYNKLYFYNSQNLNTAGVNAFTPKLGSDLKIILQK